MENYFKTVTLGAFTWRNQERISLLLVHIRKLGLGWFLLHFLLLTFCLNFPVVFSLASRQPRELYGILYGESDIPEEAAGGSFDTFLVEQGYGRALLLPVIGTSAGMTLVIQTVFFLCAVFFLGLSRMNAAPLSFRDRLGLSIFSSTVPVLPAAILGLVLPALHFLVFYFMVIALIFQRSRLCPNG